MGGYEPPHFLSTQIEIKRDSRPSRGHWSSRVSLASQGKREREEAEEEQVVNRRHHARCNPIPTCTGNKAALSTNPDSILSRLPEIALSSSSRAHESGNTRKIQCSNGHLPHSPITSRSHCSPFSCDPVSPLLSLPSPLLAVTANMTLYSSGPLHGETPCCTDRLSTATCSRLQTLHSSRFLYNCVHNADFAFVQCCRTWSVPFSFTLCNESRQFRCERDSHARLRQSRTSASHESQNRDLQRPSRRGVVHGVRPPVLSPSMCSLLSQIGFLGRATLSPFHLRDDALRLPRVSHVLWLLQFERA
jgi:hypothetical protein